MMIVRNETTFDPENLILCSLPVDLVEDIVSRLPAKELRCVCKSWKSLISHPIFANRRLPLKLLEDILCRLPVKLLIQLQCVCRYWKYLISDPIFAKKHLRYGSVRTFYSFRNFEFQECCISKSIDIEKEMKSDECLESFEDKQDQTNHGASEPRVNEHQEMEIEFQSGFKKRHHPSKDVI